MEKYNKFIIGLIVVVVIGMSIGYSALNSDLNISGEVNYRPQNDVRITSFTTNDKPSAMTIEYSDFSKHQVKLGYKTTGACSITYTIEVTNYSNVNMGILKINNLDENVKVQDNIVGTKLVGPADIQIFTITFNSTTSEIKTYLLTFDFEEIYTITYNGFGDTENYKKEIFNGQDYSQNFGSGAPTKVEVTIGGVAIENYTYSEGTLNIPSVNGDIEITAAKVCQFPSYTDNSGANAPILNGNMIPVVYSEECQSWIKQSLDKSYDYGKQIWANAVTVVENSYKEKANGIEKLDLINQVNSYTYYKSTNKDQDDSTSNLTLTFKTGSTGGTLSFDYEVSSEEGFDCLTISVNNEIKVNEISGEDGGNYSEELSPNTKYTIIADYVKDDSTKANEDTAYIKNLKVPNNLEEPLTVVSTGDYKWIEYQYDVYKYDVWSDYDLGAFTGVYSLKNGDNHDFSSSDVGKYLCPDGSVTCSELYKIKKVEGNVIKEVEKYTTEQFDVRGKYINAAVGTEIPMNYINTMWVWIPRYSYTIKSEDGGENYFGKASFGNDNPTGDLPGEIDVKFIKNETEKGIAQYIGDSATGWRTNEAFDFGGEKKSGMWVGKFETTGSLAEDDQACIDTNCDAGNVTIKPGLPSLRNQTVSSFFFMSRSMQLHNASTYGFNKSSGDLHMMKNDEWGAVAYLSQSRYGKYGNSDYTGANKEVYINNDGGMITGHSGGSTYSSGIYYEYNDMTNFGEGEGQAGPGASTTGNIYGIYDMSGGAEEYVMGVLEYDEQGVNEHSGAISPSDSGFKGLYYDEIEIGDYELPDEKYYNKYKKKDANSSSSNWVAAKPESACDGGICYGHALSETTDIDVDDDIFNYAWYYSARNFFLTRGNSWFKRGGYYPFGYSGIFRAVNCSGDPDSYNTCRLTLVP